MLGEMFKKNALYKGKYLEHYPTRRYNTNRCIRNIWGRAFNSGTTYHHIHPELLIFLTGFGSSLTSYFVPKSI